MSSTSAIATMELEFLDSIARVDSIQWQTLLASDYPFAHYQFLLALEQQGCVGEACGWTPHHLLVREAGQLVAAAPMYIKTHSWGEYIFDWAWADAFQRAGRAYYPKLLCAIPFTPATGPRLLGELTADQRSQLQQQLEAHCRVQGFSGVHWLLSSAPAAQSLSPRWALRETPQYHWFNEGYANFDDFLQNFSARKRKTVLRERRQVADQGLRLARKTGADITARDWQVFYQCYHTTYLKRSGEAGYLNLGFFQQLAHKLGDQLLMVTAHQGPEPVAAALYLFDTHTLYGRYWGCLAEFDCLHFEACYYQGIEFAIERGLARFDAGAQGEHKIARGFRPVSVYSNHWFKDADARAAIGDFIAQEQAQVQAYGRAASQKLPFKQPVR